MCECLEYADGERYQCVVCADLSRTEHEVCEALGAWVLEFDRLLLREKERGTDVAEIKKNFEAFVKKVTELIGLTEDDLECIFDVDRPPEEWSMWDDPLGLLKEETPNGEGDPPAQG